MPDIIFAPVETTLKFVQGDTVPPITIPLVDELGADLDATQYNVTCETIAPDGTRNPATAQAAAAAVMFSMTPAQSALVVEGSQWCARLATPNDSDVRTVGRGPINLILK